MNKSANSKSTVVDALQTIVFLPKNNEEKKSNNSVITLLDIILSIFIVTPLVVLTWRGCWELIELHDQYFPVLPCFFMGIIGHIILALSQDWLHKSLIQCDKNWFLKLIFHFLRRLYTYIFLLITIFHWRGGWAILDQISGVQFTFNHEVIFNTSQWMLIIWFVVSVALITIRGVRNAISPPFAICIDKGSYVFRFPTMFGKKSETNFFLTVLDCSISVVISGNFVVIFWRGLWAVTDILLDPFDFELGSLISLLLGIILVGFTFRLQSYVKNICAQSSQNVKIFAADCYIGLSIMATIFYWRGIWNLADIYFFPNNVQFGLIVSHLFSFFALIVINSSNSVLVRGIYKDGKENNGECVIFPIQYLEIIMSEEPTCDEDEELESEDSEKKIINNL